RPLRARSRVPRVPLRVGRRREQYSQYGPGERRARSGARRRRRPAPRAVSRCRRGARVMSFRARLALVAAAAVALAVVVASGVVYVVVRGELYSSVDASLRSSMEHIQHGPVFDFTEGPPQPGVFGGYPQAVRQDGVTCCKRRGESLTLPVTEHDLNVARGRSDTYYTDARVGDNHVRIITFPYQTGFAVQIARPLDETDHALSRIRWLLILIA